jgi:putative toxin-antitoxin system antitoxin component (TIGR02293 family)
MMWSHDTIWKDPTPPAQRVADVLGGPAVLGSLVRTWEQLERAVIAGLPKESLQRVARRAVGPGTPASDLVYSVVAPATFKRRTRLTAEESERTERLARVVAFADGLWGNEAATRAFLNRPHPMLDDRTPLQIARTELGARRIERLLHDVEHGLPL